MRTRQQAGYAFPPAQSLFWSTSHDSRAPNASCYRNPMIEFTVEPYSNRLDTDIARLFRLEGFERTPPYLNWIFNPPAGRGFVALALDRSSNGRVAGVLGFVPRHVLVSGKKVETFLAIDLVVDPDYRGRGVFMGLGKAGLSAAADRAAFVWGFPNANAAHAWFNRFGWVRLGEPPLMARPLRTAVLARRFGLRSGQLDFPLTQRPRSISDVVHIERFDADADSIWAETSTAFGCLAFRDAAWLNWRFVDAPGTQYRRVGLIENGSLTAFVVTARKNKNGVSLLYVVEALSIDRANQARLAHLIRNELAVAAAEGAEVALCWAPSAGCNYRAYRMAGFLSLPKWLRPSDTHFGVKPFADTPSASIVPGSWYVSYMDSDSI